MKTKLIYLPMVLSLGCASLAPISYQEQCARKGLTLAGVTSGTSSASAYNWNTNNVVTAHGNSEAVACEVPKTEMQTCEARRLASVSEPKVDYNGTTKLWNAGIGVGYFLWILPGVGLKLIADSKYDSAVNEASKRDAETAKLCTPLPAPEIRMPTSTGAP